MHYYKKIKNMLETDHLHLAQKKLFSSLNRTATQQNKNIPPKIKLCTLDYLTIFKNLTQ